MDPLGGDPEEQRGIAIVRSFLSKCNLWIAQKGEVASGQRYLLKILFSAPPHL